MTGFTTINSELGFLMESSYIPLLGIGTTNWLTECLFVSHINKLNLLCLLCPLWLFCWQRNTPICVFKW